MSGAPEAGIEILSAVFRACQAVGVAACAEDIADAAWLARWVPAPPLPLPPEAEPARGTDPLAAETQPTTHGPVSSAPESTEAAAPGGSVGLSLPAAPDLPGRAGGVTFRAPAAPALSRPLELVRALRPLARRYPSRTRFVLDPERTAARCADERVCAPVMRPAPERWLRLAVVIDVGAGSDLWRDTARELVALLTHCGAFRDVRSWTLDTDARPPRLAPGDGGEVAARDPKELNDPGGRTLTVVVSPGLASGWNDGAVAEVLGHWAAHGPVALVALLPEYLWPRSALGRGGVRVSAAGAGAANRALRCSRPGAWPGEKPPSGVPLPLVALEPGALGAWAALVAGKPGAEVPGVILRAAARPPTAPAPQTAGERVDQFLRNSSPTAQRLVGLLAAAPVVSLSVLRLIREALLPAAGQPHEAEVLFGGLLHRTGGEPGDPRFDFLPGVRAELLNAAPITESIAVLGAVSDYIGAHLASGRTFRAVLADPESAAGAVATDESEFARVAAEVLIRAGGAYKRLVRPRPATGAAAESGRSRPHPKADDSAPELPRPQTPQPVEARTTDARPVRRAAALVVGVSDYAHPDIPRPRLAAADANALADLLADPDVCGFPPEQVVRLTNADATRAAIIAHLSEHLPARGRGADLVVIFFAGVGVADFEGRPEGCFLPFDANPPDLFTTVVSVGDLIRCADALDAAAVVVLLAYADSWPARTASAGFVDGSRTLGKGRFVMGASDRRQTTVELVEMGHGLFTHHLLRGIRGEADRDGDGRVGLPELFEYVAEAVSRDARGHGFRQTPWAVTASPGGVYLSNARPHPAAPPTPNGESEPEPTALFTIPPELYERLPFPIAFHACQCGTKEANQSPANAAGYLFDAVGCLIRYLALVVVSDYVQQGRFSPTATALLRRRFRDSRLSMGHWLEMLRDVTRAFADAGRETSPPGIVGFLLARRGGRWAGSDGARQLEELTAARNRAAHTLAPSSWEQLVPLSETFCEVLRGVAFLADYPLVVPTARAPDGPVTAYRECMGLVPNFAERDAQRVEVTGEQSARLPAAGAPVLLTLDRRKVLSVLYPFQLFQDGPLGDLYAYRDSVWKADAPYRVMFEGHLRTGGDGLFEVRPHTERSAVLADLARVLGGAAEAPGAASSAAGTEPRPWAAPPELPHPFGRYRLDEYLGRGSVGVVYKAHDALFDRIVAVKIPHAGASASAEVRSEFRRTAQIGARLATLRSAHICHVLDAGEIEGCPYLAMEYIPGRTLDVYWREEAARFGPDGVADIVGNVAGVMHRAHGLALNGETIIHRDLKPTNVIVANESEGAPRPVLLNFGSTPVIPADQPNAADGHESRRTLAYTAPEQLVPGWRGATLSARSDVYSLGAILYRLLTGRAPFPADDLARFRETVLTTDFRPPGDLDPRHRPFDEVCRRAMARHPDDRYPSMAAFADALSAVRLGAQLPPPAVPTSAARPIPARATASVSGGSGTDERAWLTGTDPIALLDVLHPMRSHGNMQPQDRPSRRYLIACARKQWLRLPHVCRAIVELAEIFTDAPRELRRVRDVAAEVAEALMSSDGGPDDLQTAELALTSATDAVPEVERAFADVRRTGGASAPPLTPEEWPGAAALIYLPLEIVVPPYAWVPRELHDIDLLREVYGNPYRHVPFADAWRTSTTVALARHMYESRDFGPMPILADALQDAGCDSAEILDHCRGPGPHVRGCWVCDLILRK